MKKILVFVSLLVGSALLISLVSPEPDAESQPDTIKRHVLAQTNALLNSLHNLETTINQQNEASARQTLLEARNHYKRAEYIFEYVDPEFVKDYINGAPLPKPERKAPDLTIVQPKGFQILEEELFASTIDWQKCAALAQSLTVSTQKYQPRLQQISLQHRQVFEALRFEVVRIFTLGVSGFDTPSGTNTLHENQLALTAVFDALELYQPLYTSQRQSELEKIRQRAQELFATNYENFDHFGFLTEVINPLFELTLNVQVELGVETYELVYAQRTAFNYRSENLFDPDFLRADYYSDPTHPDLDSIRTELGRFLFFDPVLSANNERACASCHNPALAFTDGRTKSLSFDQEGTVARNSPGLINSIYADRYFWDLRTHKPEEQVEHVFLSSQEFNSSYEEITDKLNESEEYVKLFRQAFPELGNRAISKQGISSALGSYVRSLRGFNSSFDRAVRGEQPIDAEAKAGFNLFNGKAACATCHFSPTFSGLVPPLFVESESEVLGVPAEDNKANPKLDHDHGRMHNRIPKEQTDIYDHSFKTPTVRNVALTAPYMHNGAFQDLHRVISFYNDGGGQGWGLDVPNQTLPGDELELSEVEQKQLVVFLESLTDTSGLSGVPTQLPAFPQGHKLNRRRVGGSY